MVNVKYDSMTQKILVFDSHPVQYRAPIWKAIQNKSSQSIFVVYATDCSVRGYEDIGFGRNLAWDEPMLDGYEYSILNCIQGVPLKGWKSLTGEGVKDMLVKTQPTVVLLTGLNYKYDLMALMAARKFKIPIWLRCETQDHALERSFFKAIGRKIIYKLIYRYIDKFFYIGELNRLHYLKHGVSSVKLMPALYGTVNRFEGLSDGEKQKERTYIRLNSAIAAEMIVIGFSGKFISKKNPKILFDMLKYLDETIKRKIILYFMGSGEQDDMLKGLAEKAFSVYGIRSVFPGFINQSQIGSHYLAMDILVLPSMRMGETWGLVVNEAMQAGCGVIVSDAVGSSKNFGGSERFKVFNDNDSKQLALKVFELSKFTRDFNWASELLKPYSIDETSSSLLKALKNS